MGLLLALIATVARGSTAELTSLVAAGRLSDLGRPDFSDYRTQVAEFYKSTDYSLAWSRDGVPTSEARRLIEAFKDAPTKGLNSEDYDGSRWAERLSKLRRTGINQDLARFDLALTVSAIRYLSDLAFGRVNPRTVGCQLDVDRKRCDIADLIRQIANGGDATAILSEAEPPFEGYRRTLRALEIYLKLAHEGEITPLPPLPKMIEPGRSYAGASQLALILQRFGDLPADFAITKDLQVYDGVIVDAVKHFQVRHGLDPDGNIGKSTFQQLNTPISHRVRQLQLTLERWRWVPHKFSRPPIVVNIPEFSLRVLNGAFRTELEMKVVVGKAYRHRTPVFAGELKYVVFQPYWNVPRTIQRTELLPRLVRDPSYLTKNGYEVVTREGHLVTMSSVTDDALAKLRRGDFTLRQAPGAQNALGRVKFIFPNENNVYLHDTPAQQLFSRSRRDFSHGCIRVEQSEELSAWVLRDEATWLRDRIKAAMSGSQTIQVNLNRPIPILIVYGTAVALENGEVHFFDDIYGYDKLLEAQLTKR